MVRTSATTVAAYLKTLSEDRRASISRVRRVIRKHLPQGYEETINWGMISYEVPLKVFPDTYNKKPLMYLALASQKNYCSLYLCSVYQDATLMAQLQQGFAQANCPLNMGKSYLRFRSADDLPLEVIGQIVAAVPMRRYIDEYLQSRGKR